MPLINPIEVVAHDPVMLACDVLHAEKKEPIRTCMKKEESKARPSLLRFRSVRYRGCAMQGRVPPTLPACRCLPCLPPLLLASTCLLPRSGCRLWPSPFCRACLLLLVLGRCPRRMRISGHHSAPALAGPRPLAAWPAGCFGPFALDPNDLPSIFLLPHTVLQVVL